jgi:sugar lactone lactonase YvrE
MKSSPKTLLPLLAVLLCCSCGDGKPETTDYTPENSFTEGIEGPAADVYGNLFAVNYQEQGTIGKVDSEGVAGIFLKLPEGSIGNGIRFDLSGNMYIADYMGHSVYMVPRGSEKAELWARDTTMNQPNDLAISPSGNIYLSDPKWADSTGQLWLLGKDRKLRRLESGMGTTNGIEVSPDGKKLYVNESVQRNVWQFAITPDGALGEKTLLMAFEDYGMDGMRCDREGNLYIARYDKGTVAVVSPEGNLIDEIVLKGKKPSNITFGGKDGKTCYVTLADRGCIETFRASLPGNYFTQVKQSQIQH